MFNRFLETPTGIAVLVGVLFLVLMSNACHEGAHALGAWAFGDRRRSIRRRCTLNPIAHFHWLLTLVLPLLALWATSGMALVGGARPVMVAPDRVGRLGVALLSLAGPVANFLFAGFLLLVLSSFFHFELFGLTSANWLGSVAFPLFYLPIWFSVTLGLINLLPMPGLDGGHIVGAGLPTPLRRVWYALTPVSLVILFAFFFWYTGLLQMWGLENPAPPEGPNYFMIMEGKVTEYLTILDRAWERWA